MRWQNCALLRGIGKLRKKESSRQEAPKSGFDAKSVLFQSRVEAAELNCPEDLRGPDLGSFHLLDLINPPHKIS